MSVKRVIEYACDCCGKVFRVEPSTYVENIEAKQPDELKTLTLVGKEYNEDGTHWEPHSFAVHLCEDCARKAAETVNRHILKLTHDMGGFHAEPLKKEGGRMTKKNTRLTLPMPEVSEKSEDGITQQL